MSADPLITFDIELFSCLASPFVRKGLDADDEDDGRSQVSVLVAVVSSAS